MSKVLFYLLTVLITSVDVIKQQHDCPFCMNKDEYHMLKHFLKCTFAAIPQFDYWSLWLAAETANTQKIKVKVTE